MPTPLWRSTPDCARPLTELPLAPGSRLQHRRFAYHSFGGRLRSRKGWRRNLNAVTRWNLMQKIIPLPSGVALGVQRDWVSSLVRQSLSFEPYISLAAAEHLAPMIAAVLEGSHFIQRTLRQAR